MINGDGTQTSWLAWGVSNRVASPQRHTPVTGSAIVAHGGDSLGPA
jgi:hypothetical protein